MLGDRPSIREPWHDFQIIYEKYICCANASNDDEADAYWQHGTVFAVIGVVMLAGASSIVAAENSEIGSRRAAARVAFTDDEIKEGFFKIAFGAELQLDKPAEKIRKFDEPVRIFVDGEASPDRRAEIAAVINDIRTHINHLDLALTDDRQTANFTVVLVPDR